MVEKKKCPYCQAEHERRSQWCTDKCRWNDKARRNGMDCSTCGKRMPKTAANRPEGMARCRDCCRVERAEALAAGMITSSGRYRRLNWVASPLVCRCGATFLPTHHKQIHCVPWHAKKYDPKEAQRG